MNKKYLLLLLVVFLFSIHIAYSQTSKGLISLSGQTGFISTGFGSEMSGIFQLSLDGGYFLSDQLMIKGELVNILYETFSDGYWGIGLGTGARYYFGQQRLQPYIGSAIYYGHNQNVFGNSTYFSHLDLTAEAGISYFAKDHLAIEVGLPIKYLKFFSDGQSPSYRLDIMTTVGLRFFLNNKKEAE